MQPSPQELQEFLSVFKRLDQFEGEQNMIRHHGAFSQEERNSFPVQAVQRTLNWLEQLAKQGIKTKPDAK